jgi:hypothetical protein
MDKLEKQKHLLTFFEDLKEEERSALTSQLSSFDIPRLNAAFDKALKTNVPELTEISQIEPDRCVDREQLSSDEFNKLNTLGDFCICFLSFYLVVLTLLVYFKLNYQMYSLAIRFWENTHSWF